MEENKTICPYCQSDKVRKFFIGTNLGKTAKNIYPAIRMMRVIQDFTVMIAEGILEI